MCFTFLYCRKIFNLFICIRGSKSIYVPYYVYTYVNSRIYHFKPILQYLSAVKESIAIASESQKLAVIGKMAATVGHEIKNPLASLKGFTQLQREKHEEDPIYKRMIFEIENMNNMISELMEVATCKPSIYKKHDVGKIVLQVITSLREKIDELNIQFISNVEEKQ